MRHIITFISISMGLLLGSAVQAQIAHDLTVFSEKGQEFTLLVNGQAVNEVPGASITAKDINFDYARVVVRFADGTTPDIERKNLQIATPGTGPKVPVATVFAIKEKKGEQVLRFVSRSEKKIQEAPVIIIDR
ncbi:MAG: hypothetical protein KDB97_11905 [Flavobacteriales bacterium]|nr:hypothetical protein [Flavobacteriales bacterium]